MSRLCDKHYPMPVTLCSCGDDGPAKANGKRDIVIKRATETEPKSKRFIVRGWWPMSALVLLVGREGGGKSLLMAWLVASITNGVFGEPRSVLILGAEDDWEEEWLPRLIAAGADLDLVGYDASYSRDTDDGPVLDPLHLGTPEVRDELAEVMRRDGFDVLILDHLDIAIPAGSRSKDYDEMGRALRALNQWAKRTQFALLAGWHMPKGGGATQDKVIGSVAVRGSARAVWMLAQNPDDGLVYVALEKGNGLNLNRKALSFTITEATIDGGIETVIASGVSEGNHPGTGKEFVGQLIERASQPEKPKGDGGKTEVAQQWLAGVLASGPLMKRFVVDLAGRNGYSESAVEKAAAKLGVVSSQHGKQAAWALPRGDTPNGTSSSAKPHIQEATEVTDVESSATSATSVTPPDVRNPLNTPVGGGGRRHRRVASTGTDVPAGAPIDLDQIKEGLDS